MNQARILRRSHSGVPLVMRPAAECVKVWFVLTVILFVFLLVSRLIVSAFEPQLWGGPERQQVLVRNADTGASGWSR